MSETRIDVPTLTADASGCIADPNTIEIKYLIWDHGHFYAGVGYAGKRGIPCEIKVDQTGEISTEFMGWKRVFTAFEAGDYRRFVRLFEHFCQYYRECTCDREWEPVYFCAQLSGLVAQFADAEDVVPEVV